MKLSTVKYSLGLNALISEVYHTVLRIDSQVEVSNPQKLMKRVRTSPPRFLQLMNNSLVGSTDT